MAGLGREAWFASLPPHERHCDAIFYELSYPHVTWAHSKREMSVPDRRNHARHTKREKDNENGGRGPLIGLLIAIGAIVAFLATFSTNLVSVWENVRRLFLPEPVKVTLRKATATINSAIPADTASDYLPVKFVAAMQGPVDRKLTCEGEAEGQGSNLLAVALSSKSANNPTVSVELGEQEKLLALKASIPRAELQLTTLNFRLRCAEGIDCFYSYSAFAALI